MERLLLWGGPYHEDSEARRFQLGGKKEPDFPQHVS